MGAIEDSAAGIQLAKDVAVSRGEGNETEELRLINSTTHVELAWALAYMAGMLNEAFTDLAGGDTAQVLRLLTNACTEQRDTFEVQARILLDPETD